MYKHSSLNSSASSFTHNRPRGETKVCSLTMENVSKLEMVKSADAPLGRYCSAKDSSLASNSSASSLKKRYHHKDRVLESPRIVPFPYHNDSFFLPTAEHDYPGNGMVADTISATNISVYTNGSCSTFQKPYSLVSSNYKTYTEGTKGHIPSKQTKSSTSFSICNRRRSASFSTLYTHFDEKKGHERGNQSKKQLRQRLKREMLWFKSTVTMASRNSLSKSSAPSLSSITVTTLIETDSPKWYKKLWKFLKPSTHQRPRTEVKGSVSHPTLYSPTQSVWYAQYKYSPRCSSQLAVVS